MRLRHSHRMKILHCPVLLETSPSFKDQCGLHARIGEILSDHDLCAVLHGLRSTVQRAFWRAQSAADSERSVIRAQNMPVHRMGGEVRSDPRNEKSLLSNK